MNYQFASEFVRWPLKFLDFFLPCFRNFSRKEKNCVATVVSELEGVLSSTLDVDCTITRTRPEPVHPVMVAQPK